MKQMIFSYPVAVLALLLTAVTSCSKDDDNTSSDGNKEDTIDTVITDSITNNYSYYDSFKNDDISNFYGTWHLLHQTSGWGKAVDIKPGNVVVAFLEDGTMDVTYQGDWRTIFPEGKSPYSFVHVEKSIADHQPITALSFGRSTYTPHIFRFRFNQGILGLSQEAYDGYCFTLKKLKE